MEEMSGFEVNKATGCWLQRGWTTGNCGGTNWSRFLTILRDAGIWRARTPKANGNIFPGLGFGKANRRAQ